MKQSRNFLHLFPAVLCLVTALMPSGAQPAVPMLINYQGEIKSPSTGEPIADGTYEMLFRVYDVEFGGTPLWVGTHSSLNGNPVEVTGGVFHVVLGSGTGNSMDSSIFNGADRWLEIRIGMETLSPRQRITSVAYSMIAENSRLLDGKESSEFAEAAHTHSGGEITAGTVAESRIDPAIARDSEILPTVLAGDGSGSTLDADLLDGKDSAEFAAAAHNHSGNEITSGSVAEGRIDASIARDSEVDSKVSNHAAIADAHHSKTTSFTELSDAAADSQIPTGIARDAEIMPTVLANDGTGSGLDADRIDGAESATLEESAEIDADIAAHTAIAGAHHAKTTSFSELTDIASDSQIPGPIARDSEVTSAVSSHTAITDAHHARYTNAEAVAAMGAKADTNPLNHDKTTSLPWASITGLPVGFADGIDNDTTYSEGAGLNLTGTVFSAEFGGTGSAATVSRSDHNHDASYVNEGQADSVTSAMIVDGAIANADVNAAAAIAGSKIDPDFGSQDVVTTGRIGVGTTSPNAKLEVVSSAGQDSVQIGQGEVRTDNVAASTSRYVVSIGGTGYWGLGKTNTGNNNFHIINYPSSRWDLTVRNDTGNVGVGTTSPQEKLDVNGNARVAGDFTVVGTATFGGGTMSKIYLTTNSTIVSTRGGTNVLSWDATNGEIELSNTSGDWCDYWWQAQKGATTSGNSGATATGTSNVAIISGTNNNDYGFEIHFGQADGTGGWCSVWLQYANGALIGHYIKY